MRCQQHLLVYSSRKYYKTTTSLAPFALASCSTTVCGSTQVSTKQNRNRSYQRRKRDTISECADKLLSKMHTDLGRQFMGRPYVCRYFQSHMDELPLERLGNQCESPVSQHIVNYLVMTRCRTLSRIIIPAPTIKFQVSDLGHTAFRLAWYRLNALLAR